MLFAGAAPRPVIAALPRMPRQFQREQLLPCNRHGRSWPRVQCARCALEVASPEAGADAAPRRTRPITITPPPHTVTGEVSRATSVTGFAGLPRRAGLARKTHSSCPNLDRKGRIGRPVGTPGVDGI